MTNAIKYIIALAVILCGTLDAQAQFTSFTYQGRLNDGATTATGDYDFEIRLFDAVSGGAQQGATAQRLNVAVAGGLFTVQLDFGDNFPGAARFLEIGVRAAGGGSFTTLTPRQPVTSTPYAVRSVSAATADNATQLGGVTAGSFVQTTDSRLSDNRNPLPNSPSYIQNTNSVQPFSNFNVSGNGTVGSILTGYIVNTPNQYNIGGSRVLSVLGSNNTYVGINAGNSNANGGNNSFFGTFAGQSNTGTANSFFGVNAGLVNSTGSYNTFFGSNAGAANITAVNNSFFGQGAGFRNTLGHDNTFIGNGAGLNITTASNNTMVGGLAGQFGNGAHNTFVGYGAGNLNSGNGNTYLGYSAGGSVSLNNATAIGANAFAGQSNSIILGGINGVNGATANTSVGIGTSYPSASLHVSANNGNMLVGNVGCGAGYIGIGFASTLNGCQNYSLMGDGSYTIINGPGSVSFRTNNSEVAYINQAGKFVVENTFAVQQLGSAQFSVSLCINSLSELSYCSSSLRYKKDLQPFKGGLDMLNRLKPITFKWKADNEPDLGFGAEDVAEVEPLLVTHNKKGEIEGVKYDRISAILVNAVKEQQAQIEAQQQQVDALTKLLQQRTPRRAHARRRR